MIQIAAKNWQAYGHILGTNEILGIMLHRDLMVLGLSDGVLFAATGYGWILQKLILKGYLSWDSTGWIIQNVCYPAAQASLQLLTIVCSRSGKHFTSLLSCLGHCLENGLGLTQSFSFYMAL
jgi:hypothetical protein